MTVDQWSSDRKEGQNMKETKKLLAAQVQIRIKTHENVHYKYAPFFAENI